MPVYTYQVVGEEEYFEVEQRMVDPALEVHPETGAPVRRVITTPALVLAHGAGRQREILSDRNVAEKGFTRYRRVERGVYEKTAGHGPGQLDSRQIQTREN